MDWQDSLEGVRGKAWDLLEAGAAPMRFVVLATLGEDGGPAARMVVLRNASRTEGTVDIHTDVASRKCREIAADPRAAVQAWDPETQIQIRLNGPMAVLRGADSAPYWPAIPDGSRASYGVTPAPGTPIPAADAYDRAPDPAKFAVLRLTVEKIDLVHLAEDFHRRALFRRADGWAGQWIAP